MSLIKNKKFVFFVKKTLKKVNDDKKNKVNICGFFIDKSINQRTKERKKVTKYLFICFYQLILLILCLHIRK
jgi:hypothetical protein